jgi:DNA-binding XRE family transcriptional regulator
MQNKCETNPNDTGNARHRQWMKRKADEAALQSLAIHVRSMRKAMKISVEELAGRVGCTEKNIYHIERGENFPSMQVYLAICRAFGLEKPPLV